jgi:hypothetical protein
MKSIRIVFVALVAVFAFSAVAASSALASPEWYAKKSGTWAKITTPVAFEAESKYEFTDTKLAIWKVIGKEATIACTGTTKGVVGAGAAAKLNELRSSSCACSIPGSECTFTRDEVRNLPWLTELYKEGTEIRSKFVSNGGKLPVWIFAYEFSGQGFGDECLVNTSTHMANTATGVEAKFDAKSSKTKCSEGGAEAGEWKGFIKMKPTEKGVEAIKVE